MENKILISVESTCDLGTRLTQKYGVVTLPLHITQNGNTFEDRVNITPQEIYSSFEKTGELPKTAAVSVGEYKAFFKKATQDGYQVIHLAVTPEISCCYQNSLIAKGEMENIHIINTRSFTVGTALLVTETQKRIEMGMEVNQIVEQVSKISNRIHASFLVDKLDYLCAGGRCSTATKLGANLLSLKPCIEISTETGGMTVGKKYRGKFEKTLKDYIDDKMASYSNICKERVFVAEAGTDPQMVQAVVEYLKDKQYFQKIELVQASCTISSHCGPDTMGMAFMTEE